MNREQRRASGVSKETSDKLNDLKKPCTILEAVQLAQGVADDAIKNYHETLNPIIVSLSLQLEILKEMLVSSGIINEEEFINRFNDRVGEYNKQRDEAISEIQKSVNSNKSAVAPKTDVVAGDIELKVE